MNPRLLCQSFFALGIVVDLGGLLFPWFKQEIMPYGSRRLETSPGKGAKSNSKIIGDFVASVQVPHSWFTYFYVFSVASSAFWGYQIFERGAAFQFLAAHSSKDVSKAMSAEQALLLWFLMALQGLRRLYESIVFTKPSQAKMWIGLWVIGIAYYLFTGIGVWIEGIGERLFERAVKQN
ncbi:hypothetical protein GLAREA_05521 [Glarea lozoyensis ATCC 20868]|uniref:Polyprenal reductase n=1 Tax=Glarea lozoyensis (strain ATCC 20868 / MF5171) TaxID=1116229 RepID=S3ED17_GLAL2|nr:uncharacterized protein GLAREA_05521 [Glarea lozoyensis ATCC 20868]EPE36183.1 hypothetical protein GLAREA_05521 [Glarea lozoyensis ATCC 20868]